MTKKALFFDLDNTIYPVTAIGDQLFEPLSALIIQSGEYTGHIESIRSLIFRKPFQYVAEQHQMSASLRDRALQLLQDLTYPYPIEAFDDYHQTRHLPQKKYLITAGFTNLQLSKVKALNIEADFDGIYIVDHLRSNDTKKIVFQRIMDENSYDAKDVLVIGDDPASEIKAAAELGIDAVCYDSLGLWQEGMDSQRITDFGELGMYL